MLFFIISMIKGFSIDIKRALSINQYLIILLIGVGFLRLITTPKSLDNIKESRGRKSFINTYLSIHLFGSVINLSALILVGDKFIQKAKLTNLQIILLTRAFSSDAFWSPFFVAFGAAITYIPHLQLSYTVFTGLILSFFAFLVTYFEIKDKKELDSFVGYPMRYDTLFLPFILAAIVLIVNHYNPELKVIVLVSFSSILLSVLLLPTKIGLKKSIYTFKTHIEVELPKMRAELSLFLIAGMFGVSISTIFSGMGLEFPFDYFDYKIASLTLFVFIVLAFIGIHPVITIAVLSDMLSGFNNTLLAITFLMAWAITIGTSPFSGVNLTVQGRYNVDAVEIFKLNIFYAVKMYFVCVIILFFVSRFLAI